MSDPGIRSANQTISCELGKRREKNISWPEYLKVHSNVTKLLQEAVDSLNMG